ncbi:MAG: HAMP domain-containing histidine kinase [Coriobacteriia bacterium]|nr:HAMP domain-containing histidine kinase [Coriobacteriia bacterium]
MRRVGLNLQVFLSILLVSLGAVLTVGLVARNALASAFDSYLATLPTPSGDGRMHMGRRMLGAAEQTFVASVDRSVLIGAVAAVVITTIVAVLLARHFSRPIRTLESAAEALAAGDLSRRVTPAGPTEVATLGDAFNRMADSLEEAETLRRRLVADVAHELRNPIAAARVHAEGMAEGVLPPTQARFDALVSDLGHLSVLVTDLQHLAIAEAGQLRYEVAALDLADLARRETARIADSRPGDVTITAQAAEPVWVDGDELRLSEVLRNLLSNAIRHTSTGSITVTATVLSDGRAEVRVTDTGEGIPAEDLPYVFERFYRADTARATDTGGAGLGLAISRRIVEDHGGEAFAENTAGGGAIVGFSMPAAQKPTA